MSEKEMSWKEFTFDVDKRLSELEKNQNKIIGFIDILDKGGLIEQIQEKVEELEKVQRDTIIDYGNRMTELEMDIKNIFDDEQDFINAITELKNELAGTNNRTFLWCGKVEKWVEELKETLKDHIRSMGESTQTEFDRLESVLKELIDLVEYHHRREEEEECEAYGIEEYTSSFDEMRNKLSGEKESRKGVKGSLPEEGSSQPEACRDHSKPERIKAFEKAGLNVIYKPEDLEKFFEGEKPAEPKSILGHVITYTEEEMKELLESEPNDDYKFELPDTIEELHNSIEKWLKIVESRVSEKLIAEFIEYLERKSGELDDWGENILDMYYGETEYFDGYRKELEKEIEKWQQRLEE